MKNISNHNIGLVGLGYWGPNILRALLKNKQCKVKTVVDKSSLRLKYARTLKPKLLVSKDINLILNDKSIDSVFICTPAFTHYEIAKKFLNKKKNVFVEKPIVTKKAQLTYLFNLAKKNNLLLMSGDQYIFHPAIIKIKKMLDSNILGKIYYMNLDRLNLGRIRSDIDVKLNFSTHDIGIVQYLLEYKNPISVKNYDLKILQKNISDVSQINLIYKNRINVNINVSWLHNEKVRKILIVGSKKMLFYNDLKPSYIYILNKSVVKIHSNTSAEFDKKFDTKFKYINNQAKKIKVKKEEPLKNEINHFFFCIDNNKMKCKTGEKHCESVFRIIEKFKN